MLMPSHARRVQPYRDPSIPLFFRYQVETQIDLIHNPVAHLRSGGYIVINQTEALVSIDVNSGRSTRERNIEETALKTNCEAADEIARQLRLRDMGGLIVIDLIDMDEPRHDAQVERRLKEAMKNDRARIQVGRISPFGLLELSRQRLHPSLIETNFHTCAHCLGTGLVRSIESASLLVLRAIEEEGIKHRAAEISVTVAGNIALYVLNQKRGALTEIEQRYGFSVRVLADDSLIAPEHRIDRIRAKPPGMEPPPLNLTATIAAHEAEDDIPDEVEEAEESAPSSDRGRRSPEAASETTGDGEPAKRKRRRNRRRRGRDDRPDDAAGTLPPQQSFDDGSAPNEDDSSGQQPDVVEETVEGDEAQTSSQGTDVGVPEDGETAAEGAARRRRRGRRGGRSRSRRSDEDSNDISTQAEGDTDDQSPAETETIEAPSNDVTVTPEAEAETPSVAEAAPSTVQEDVPAEPPEPEPAQPAPVAPVAREYEIVNQPPAQPRRGFWKRLVE